MLTQAKLGLVSITTSAICNAATLSALLTAPLYAQPSPAAPEHSTGHTVIPFDQADAEQAITDLATALQDNFVFPEKGKAYADMLRRNLAAGKYAGFPDAERFADQVTADLQAVHEDRHLRVRPSTAGQRARREEGGTRSDGESLSSVSRSGWLSEGVAYIDTRGFPGNEATLTDVRNFIAAHANATTLIIDARQNRGGGLDEMNLLFSQIFANPTTLVVMDIRQAVEEKRGSPFGDDPTLRRVNGPPTIIRREHLAIPAAEQHSLRNAKIYLLTSNKTFSAAEHLSLALKRTHRATLVGEATGGGAHFGGRVPLGESYDAFIPVGRTFDPDTAQSWEGAGVKPDVEVPAERALDEALKLAGVNRSGEAAPAALD